MGKNAAILRLQVLSQKAAPDATPKSPLSARMLHAPNDASTRPKSPLSSRILHASDSSDTKIIHFGQMIGVKNGKKLHGKASGGVAAADAKPSLTYSVKLLKRGQGHAVFGYVCGQTGCRPKQEVSI